MGEEKEKKKKNKKKMHMANIAQQRRADRASRHFVSTAFLFSLRVDAHLMTILLLLLLLPTKVLLLPLRSRAEEGDAGP